MSSETENILPSVFNVQCPKCKAQVGHKCGKWINGNWFEMLLEVHIQRFEAWEIVFWRRM